MMNNIRKATINDAGLLAEMGRLSFFESHGHSAPVETVEAYISQNFEAGLIREELAARENIFHIILHDGREAGYSKIVFNSSHPGSSLENVTKLQRIYLLKEHYGIGLGYELLRHNLALAKTYGQTGMWLYVWKENYRAVNFYLKNGFKIAGSYYFKISAAHSNPNHIMFLAF